MSIYAHIKRCLELSDKDIATAIGDRRLAKGLLDQLSKVSRPGDGAPKLLLVFAKMAAQQVDWVDGAMRVEMIGDGEITVVEVLTELGLGMHERVFPSFKMAVPLDEFARAVERVPHMIEPLAIASKSPRRLVLTAQAADEEVRPSQDPPAAVSIADDSLYGSELDEVAKAARQSPFVKIEPAPKRTMSSGKHRAVRKSSRPHAEPSPQEAPTKVLVSKTKTLRPAPMAPEPAKKRSGPPPLPKTKSEKPPKAESVKPPKTESVKPEKRASMKPPKRETAKPPKSVKPEKRASLRPTKRASMKPGKSKSEPPPSTKAIPKPPALPRMETKPQGAAIARVQLTRIAAPQRAPGVIAAKEVAHAPPTKRHSKPPPRNSKPPPRNSQPPPKSTRARAVASEPPDEESIDLGWEDD